MAIRLMSSTTDKPNASASGGIDCPEKGQAYGQKAKQATSGLVFKQEATLQPHGKYS
jgi:endonuclease YncB( thermonuclease family)